MGRRESVQTMYFFVDSHSLLFLSEGSGMPSLTDWITAISTLVMAVMAVLVYLSQSTPSPPPSPPPNTSSGGDTELARLTREVLQLRGDNEFIMDFLRALINDKVNADSEEQHPSRSG